MIEVNQLTKRYGGFTAVNGISFRAVRGVTGFLGPNGAGKTTTMRMLTGYLPPTDGNATVAGYDVFKQSIKARQHVGYLPESVPLYRDMTAIGYLMYIAEIRGVKHRRERAETILARVGLANRANSQIRTLSKGMRQRVGLASALIHDPEVLILDEPTIGLDPIQVLELRDLVRELGERHTVLFSTHILSEAEQVCDDVIIINHGSIVAQGAPAALRGELERGGRVLVRADVAIEQLLPVVREISGIGSVEISLNGVIATPSTTDDPRPQIASAIVNRGWRLLELRPVAVNLEEIFLELTRQGNKDAEAAEVAE
ncbi:MAG: putative ABC transporter ATP-binding protein [Chloroflexi bacterium OLB15]|nr:MAG: putative ABC transporter ATP-binding protein [Chloroflexi bacterium OLB15]